MKRSILLIVTLSLTFLLTACGMTPEEIDTALTQLDTAYQSGIYEQAHNEVKKLDKSYKKMSDEQKTKFDELKSSVEYAVASIDAINEIFDNAQGFYDQKLYYEASQEIEKLVAEYTLPPMEEKKYDEKKTLIDVGIKSWKSTSALQEVENLYNSGDYDLANTKISEIDTTLLTEERQQTYNDLQKKIEASRSLVEVEGYYNSGSYTSASNTLSGINTAYLTSEQNQKYGSLKEKIANAKAEAERKAENSTISYDKALELVKKYYRTYTTYNPPFYEKYDETASRWIIRAYEVISYPGELSHTSTFNIIGVDKKTGALYDEIVMETIIDDNGKYVANK